PDGDGAAGDHPGVVEQVRRRDVLAQLGQGSALGDRDEVAAPEPADLSFDAALLMGALQTGLAEERLETVFSELLMAELQRSSSRILMTC
ncbi:hypothetical protein, partial [Aeromicrobium sp.]|uniref:hypothetical protein n=1 Tax=Aeromicrobium sp. TaxID=1871063 RepID=UPI0019BD080B